METDDSRLSSLGKLMTSLAVSGIGVVPVLFVP